MDRRAPRRRVATVDFLSLSAAIVTELLLSPAPMNASSTAKPRLRGVILLALIPVLGGMLYMGGRALRPSSPAPAAAPPLAAAVERSTNTAAPSSPPLQTEIAQESASEFIEEDGSLEPDDGRETDPYEYNEPLTPPDYGSRVRPSERHIETAAEEEPEPLPEPTEATPPESVPATEALQRTRARQASIDSQTRTAADASRCSYMPDGASQEVLDGRNLPDDLRARFSAPKFDVVSYDHNAQKRFVIVDGVRVAEGQAMGNGNSLLRVEADAVVVMHEGCSIRLARRR